MYTFTKLHDKRIPKVGVGVGPMEFQLYRHYYEEVYAYGNVNLT